MQPVLSFPYTISGLSAGNYEVELLDGFSCSITFNLVVKSVSAETVNLGPDQTVLVGDSAMIHPLLSFSPDSFYWTGDVSLLDPNLLDNVIAPVADQSFMLFAVDSKGCLYSDDLKIRVLLHSSVIIPSVFSPNDDNINDVLAVKSDPSITMIEYFEIFSRWGELVYSAKNFTPDQTTGWDGTLGGKKLLPGVFVYRLKAVNKKGNHIEQTGDITLIK
jgi:gliding motility-associated-like protein